MELQAVVINVADLDRSIAFYSEVFGFTLLTRKDQLAVVNAPDSDRTQVLVLRAFGTSPMGGARHLGLRSFVLEVDSTDQQERIAAGLKARNALLDRHEHSEWIAVVGRDPDGVAITVAWHSGGTAAAEDSWKTLDDFVYGIGE